MMSDLKNFHSAVAGFLKREATHTKATIEDLQALTNGPKLSEECGVFGIIGTEKAGGLTSLGLHALQHRGQEAAGIVTYDGTQFYQERKNGLVSDNFSSSEMLEKIPGYAGIGHTRYSTTGDSIERNIQPLYADLDRGGFAIAHNGNLTNTHTKRSELIRKGSIFQTTSDSELFVQLAALSRGMTMVDKLIDALGDVEGAYALVALSQHAMIGVRDPIGIRPTCARQARQCLCLGLRNLRL